MRIGSTPADFMNTRAQNSAFRPGAGIRSGPSPAYFRLSHLRKMKGRQQVAAVCYRVRGDTIEFLLVETRRRRWTFPKGSAEPGLTHAQAAALEAYEEAGVHGRIEETPFTRYVRSKRGGKQKSKPSDRSFPQSAEHDILIDVHLCQVLRLNPPEEARRNPTWFPAAKAKRRLREDRSPAYGDELARVVDLAVTRIRELHASPSQAGGGRTIGAPLPASRKNGSANTDRARRGISDGRMSQGRVVEKSVARKKDALQRVQFEASASLPGGVQAAFVRYVRREVADLGGAAGHRTAAGQALAINAYVSGVPRLSSPPTQRAQITTIDQARKPNHKAAFQKNR
jgi:8-oxo-dGTP pyrophosphatase MutT (NUDIX family)